MGTVKHGNLHTDLGSIVPLGTINNPIRRRVRIFAGFQNFERPEKHTADPVQVTEDLGLLLIVAFSLGLAATLTVLGLAVVYARHLIPPRLAAGRLAAALPAASALLIVAVGCVLTVKAVPGVV